MPRSLLAVLLLSVAACKKAEPEPAADTAREAKLAVGMPAPSLNVSEWVKGDPVPAFEPGKAYVVEFWATWCGPCLSTMPHLGTLAKQYKSQGLTVLAVTTTDDRGNTQETVAQFAAGRGKDLAVTIARCDTTDTKAAYMDAAGITGLPATFVVDREGKIAYLGHPEDLDEVLPKVLAGTWRGSADAHALKQQEAELEDILGKIQLASDLAKLAVGRVERETAVASINKAIAKAAGEAVGELTAYAARYPGRAAKATFQLNKAQVLLTAGRADDARTVTAGVLAQSAERKNPDMLRVIIDLWTSPNLNPRRQFPELPMRAADEWIAIEGETVGTLMMAAQAYLFAGEKEKGRSFGAKAMSLSPDPRMKAGMEQKLREWEG